MTPLPSLRGLRLLVVEDEALIAMMLEDMLADLGCIVADVAGTLDTGLARAADAALSVDGAILDVNLGGECVYPVAERLASRGVPFVFCTGYGNQGPGSKFAAVPTLAKPYSREDLALFLLTNLADARKR